MLGHILYLLYKSDQPLSIDKCNIDMYADDSTLHTCGSHVYWFKQNSMSIRRTSCAMLVRS